MSDKIIFWLSPDLTYFGLAHQIQKQYDCKLYAIIDITNKPKKFFQQQNFVKFTEQWFFHDYIKKNHQPDINYLKSIEKKYQIDIWKLMINERTLYRFYNFHKFTSDQMLSIAEQACKLFENILDSVQPDFVICREPGFFHMEIFYEMCRSRKIKVLLLSIPKIGYKCRITDDPQFMSTYDELEKTESQNRTFEELRNYLKTYDPGKSASASMEKWTKSTGQSKTELFKAATDYLLFSRNKNIKTHYTYFGRTKIRVLLFQISSIIKKFFRAQFMNNNLEKNVNLSKPFVYFALGVDLERNILINAPFCTNQIEIIRHIAKSLPIGYDLYVKEAPGQATRGWRQISEYKEIMAIPNVTLIHPTFPSQKLIEKSSLVITISGSSGFETAFYGPSIIFADNVYSILPSVTVIKKLEDLPTIIKNSLENKIDPNDLDKYVTLLEKNCFDFDWTGLTNKIAEIFFYNGMLVDVEISQDKMNQFLENFESVFKNLAEKHIKKLNELK